MEWRDNEGVPQLVFGEELSIGEGLEKARGSRDNFSMEPRNGINFCENGYF